jgi:MoaA/NifB/PqqE/SkfB family radical SAM enzyme
VDSAVFKQGKFTPATHIPIVAPQALEQDPVDAVIVMAASYCDEVVDLIKKRSNKKMDLAVLKGGHLQKVASNDQREVISFGATKLDESARRDWLKTRKPRVWQKVNAFADKVKRGESIAIIQFQYSYACNFKCEHCSIDQFFMRPSQERSSGRRFFTLRDVKELARQAHEMGLANFVLTGGEPLIFKDFDGLVEAIGPENFYLVTDTNGWHLDLERAKHLKSIGIDKVQLSLDGLDAKQHDTFRRKKGSHARVMRAIEACKEADLHVILSTVMWKDRVHSQEFIDYLEFAKSKGIGTYVSFIKPVGNYKGRFDQLVTEKDTEYIVGLEKKYDVFTHLTPSYGLDLGCIAVKRILPITRYGDVLPCPYTHISMGNFFKEPLKTIVERSLKNKWFSYGKKFGCLCGVDMEFIEQVVAKTYDKPVPVDQSEIFK